MKITVHLKDENGRHLSKHSAKLPFEGAGHVETDITCPHCGAVNIDVSGSGDVTHNHDTYMAVAIHHDRQCARAIGAIHTKVSTIFGIEEDERVLNGRARVY